MTEHKETKEPKDPLAAPPEIAGSRYPVDPRIEVAERTTEFQDAGPGEPGYYNPPNPNLGVSHTGPNEIRPPELVEQAEYIPDTRSAYDKKMQGETGDGKKSKDKSKKTDEEYEEMTVPELRELADKRGIDVKSDARKDEIIDALKKG